MKAVLVAGVSGVVSSGQSYSLHFSEPVSFSAAWTIRRNRERIIDTAAHRRLR